VSIPRISLPNCPECDSDDASIIYEHFGVRNLTCGTCGYAWRVQVPHADAGHARQARRLSIANRARVVKQKSSRVGS